MRFYWVAYSLGILAAVGMRGCQQASPSSASLAQQVASAAVSVKAQDSCTLTALTHYPLVRVDTTYRALPLAYPLKQSLLACLPSLSTAQASLLGCTSLPMGKAYFINCSWGSVHQLYMTVQDSAGLCRATHLLAQANLAGAGGRSSYSKLDVQGKGFTRTLLDVNVLDSHDGPEPPDEEGRYDCRLDSTVQRVQLQAEGQGKVVSERTWRFVRKIKL